MTLDNHLAPDLDQLTLILGFLYCQRMRRREKEKKDFQREVHPTLMRSAQVADFLL